MQGTGNAHGAPRAADRAALTSTFSARIEPSAAGRSTIGRTVPALEHLAHDHADLNVRILAVAARIREGASEGLAAELRDIREHLFLHFAREEEGLFPFVAQNLPDLADRVEAMTIAHDAICGALARMCRLAAGDGAMTALLDRFETSYAEHARAEAALLRELDERLDASQRAQLAELVAGL